jgi:hypothetical protein
VLPHLLAEKRIVAAYVHVVLTLYDMVAVTYLQADVQQQEKRQQKSAKFRGK